MVSRYVVIGAGAVGGTVAAELSAAGLDVVVVARGANLAALRAGGLRYLRPDGEHRVALAVAGGPEEVELRAGDVLVLATKSQDSEALLATWAWQSVSGGEPGQVAAEAVPVVLLQNGLDSARCALRRFATVIDAVVVVPSSHLTPGEVVANGAPLAGGFILGLAGAPPADDAARKAAADVIEQVAADLRRSSFATAIVDDIVRWKAGKLLGNLAHNIDAAVPPGPLRDVAVRAVVDEAKAALAAAGVDPADPLTARILDLSSFRIHEIPGYERQGSSTWQSLARGGSVESDFLNGEIVLLARLHGLAAPVNAAVARWIATAARTGAPPASVRDAELAIVLRAAGHTLPPPWDQTTP
ncbi:MAG: ketopantoate reductase family protein [Frankia sp.]|nr:ketopantoate reductase family protein [Frankia sp.]